jgi:hypothetical protein
MLEPTTPAPMMITSADSKRFSFYPRRKPAGTPGGARMPRGAAHELTTGINIRSTRRKFSGSPITMR